MDLQDRTVQAAIGHLSNAEQFVGEKPYEIFIDTQPGRPKTNMKFALCDGIPVKDVRFHGREQFSLDKSGFEFVNHSFDDQITINSIKQSGGDAALQSYLKPLQVFLQQHLKADKVILYDWRIRSTLPDATWPRTADRFIQLPPASWVHADESGLCGQKIVREHLAVEEREGFDSGEGRFRIINIWRPLVPVVLEKPLALCDWSSVKSVDWELCDQVLKDRVDEAMYLKNRQEHKWWWLPEQQRDELTLFVVWDSFKFRQGHQASTPHAAFDLPGPRSGQSRESIEVRSIIWTRD